MSSLQIRKILPEFGAEITGIDLNQPFTPEQEADLVTAIADYGVCVYPDTGLTDQTHIWFSRIFGNLWTIGGQGTRRSRFDHPHLFEAGNLAVDGTISDDERDVFRCMSRGVTNRQTNAADIHRIAPAHELRPVAICKLVSPIRPAFARKKEF